VCRQGIKAAMTIDSISKYVQDSYAEMILRFAVAAEYKDDETGKHIIRVSDYSTAIARALKLPKKNIEIIRFASIMHDIGKLGVPNTILHRKNISSRDYDKIKEHTIIGDKIFSGSNSPLLKAAGQIALSHHEWFDGSGYPHSLKGEKIPLMGRIVALADAFDAIVSKRKYKKPESFENTVEIIKSQRGTHFDPKIVDAFIKAIPDIKKILKASRTIDDFLKENIVILKKTP
jgi:putative two-component system response regulator